MKFKIILIATILLASSIAIAQVDRMLTVQFDITKDNRVQLIGVRVLEGGEPFETVTDSPYSFELLDAAGNVLSTTKFRVSFEAYALPVPADVLPDFNGTIPPIKKDVDRINVKVPYLENAAKFRIKSDGSILLESELTLCNKDNVCQVNKGENFLSCPSDCPSGSKDDLCDGVFDNVCDPDCDAQARKEKDVDCTCGNNVCDARENSFYCPQDCGQPVNYFLYTVLAIPIVIILLTVGIKIALRRRKKSAQKK